MEAIQTGKNYDAIAQWWYEQDRVLEYGVRLSGGALGFVKKRGIALVVKPDQEADGSHPYNIERKLERR